MLSVVVVNNCYRGGGLSKIHTSIRSVEKTVVIIQVR